MSNEPDTLPVFPTNAPAIFSDPDATTANFTEVLNRLAAVIDVDPDHLDNPTPCAGFDVAQLRNHVLGWLQFFAAALTDPAASSPRPDADAFSLGDGIVASQLVEHARVDICAAINADVAGQMVTMTGSRMAGDGVLAMALGEYIVHAWDLATSTGQEYAAPAESVAPAHEFLLGMVAPEYRGPDTGFFDAEVAVAETASDLDKLLGFGGRDPHWSPG